MRITRMIVFTVLVITMTGCSSTPQESGDYISKDGDIVLEVEKFELTNAKVQELAEASGGKTVVLKDDSSKAERTINLKAGNYNFTLYVQGASSEEDASYISVGGDSEERVYPDDVESILETQDVYYTQKEDGPCSIVITFAEENVQLDRVEIETVK